MSAIMYWDRKRIDLDTAVVMTDHAHLLFRIIDGSSLSAILHNIKSYSANEINKLTRKQGAFWLDESFDHIIRDWIAQLESGHLSLPAAPPNHTR